MAFKHHHVFFYSLPDVVKVHKLNKINGHSFVISV